LITVPTVSNGATAMAAMSRDIGFGVIISSTITEAIQSVAKATENPKAGLATTTVWLRWRSSGLTLRRSYKR
jgi:hypothetical protein